MLIRLLRMELSWVVLRWLRGMSRFNVPQLEVDSTDTTTACSTSRQAKNSF